MPHEQKPKIVPSDLLGFTYCEPPFKIPNIKSLAPVLGGVGLEVSFDYPPPDHDDEFTTGLTKQVFPWATRESIPGQERTEPVSIPYDVGVDLSGVSESRLGYGKVPKLEISSLFSTIADVRDWLASQYPAETYPDIHKIVTDGNVLIRICSTSRLPMILMRGTDRDGSSSLSSGGIDDEESTVSAYNYNAGNVTYASLKTPETKNNNGDDTFMLTGYGGVMLIYDPRKLVKLGNTSNGLSAFTAPPSTALLGIIQSVHPSAGARPTEDDLKAYLEYSEERRKALRR